MRVLMQESNNLKCIEKARFDKYNALTPIDWVCFLVTKILTATWEMKTLTLDFPWMTKCVG